MTLKPLFHRLNSTFFHSQNRELAMRKKLFLLLLIGSSLTLNCFGRVSTLLRLAIRSYSAKASKKIIPKGSLSEKEEQMKVLARRIRKASREFYGSHTTDTALGNYVYLRRLEKEMFDLKYLKTEKNVVAKTTPKKTTPAYLKAEIGEFYE